MKIHSIALPYINWFDEKYILTKAKPSQMKNEFLNLYKSKFNNLFKKLIIKKIEFLFQLHHILCYECTRKRKKKKLD